MSVTILVVDDEAHARQNIEEYLTPLGYEVIGAATLEEARNCVKRGDGDVILLDVTLPDGYGPSLLYETNTLPMRPPIIIITAHGDIDMAVDAMNNGTREVKTGAEVVNAAGASFREIADLVAEVSDQIKQMSAAIEQMATGSQQIVGAVKKIDDLSKKSAEEAESVSAATEEQLASMEEISTSSRALAVLAQDLQAAVARFRI